MTRHRPAPPRPAPPAGGKPLVVVRVLGSLGMGGAEVRLLDLLPRLTTAGITTHVVTLTDRPGMLAPRAARLGATVHPIRLDLRFPVRFLRLLWQLRPDVVHCDVATLSGALLLLAALSRVPIRIAHFRGGSDDAPGDRPHRQLQRQLLRKLIDRFATQIVGVSPGTLSYRYRPDWPADPRCQVLPTGIDINRLAGTPQTRLRKTINARPDELLCLHVGRPTPEKRRWRIPLIVAALRARGIASRAVLVGPRHPGDEERVMAAARAAGVADRIHLLGPRPEVGTLLRQADLVLLPSSREGLPGVLLEASAVGTVAVASDLPEVRLVAEQLPGVVTVDPRAPADQWAAAIIATGARPGAARDRAAAAAAFTVSDFHIDTAADRLRSLYGQAQRDVATR